MAGNIPKEEWIAQQNAKRQQELSEMSNGEKRHFFALKGMPSPAVRRAYADAVKNNPTVSMADKADVQKVMDRKKHWFKDKPVVDQNAPERRYLNELRAERETKGK